MILIMRYIDWMTWEDIAERLYFSKATIKRKHEKAIELLKICQAAYIEKTSKIRIMELDKKIE